MNPATPVTSAFKGSLVDERLLLEQRSYSRGKAARPAVAIECGVHGAAGDERGAVGHADDFVGEFYAHVRQDAAGRANVQLVVVPGRLSVLAVRLDDRQAHPVAFE